MAQVVALPRPIPGTIQIATRFDHPGDTFDIGEFRGRQGSGGVSQAWVRTDSPNIYYVFEDSGLIVAINLKTSKMYGEPAIRWVDDAVLTVGQQWFYRGEGPGRTGTIKSVTAATRGPSMDHAEAERAAGGITEMVAAEFDQGMVDLFGGAWEALAVNCLQERLQEAGRTL